MDYAPLFRDLYRIERIVAQSDERILFVAHDPVLKRRVALRVHTDERGRGRAWFMRESEVLAALDHPSIRHVYAAGVRDGVAYRVGNWIEGESLASAVARGPRPIPVLLSLARDLLSALDHAHVHGVTIRRILPTTLMLDVSGRAIVTDLRYANRVLEVIPHPDAESNHPFLAPQVRGGQGGDPSADIYTAGAVLYYALTGVAPQGPVVSPRKIRAHVPQVLDRIVVRALQQKAGDRYHTAAEMLADFAADTDAFNVLGAGPPSAILPSSPLWERRLRRALGDDYELLAELGTGSFGRVYRVRDLDLEREVALKVLDPTLTADPEVVERFQREAQLAARLQHPNIVSIYDIGGRLGLIWYTMELITGQSVAQLVQTLGPLAVPRAIELLDDTLAALEHAHVQRLVHRDIKPENLLLDPESRVHVTDFGLALAVPRGRLFGGATSRSGTPQFAAPEQLVGGQVDPRTDLFSLGAVGYFTLLGRPPFEERSAEAVLRGQVAAEPPPLHAVREDVSELLEAVLRKACAFDPAARFSSATAFREALEACGHRAGERPVVSKEGLLRRLARLL